MFDFGIRIQELRMEHNMSQEALGKKLNKSKSAICGYENNTRVPPLDVLINIAVLFNVSLDYLVGIDKNEMVSVNGLNENQKDLVYTLVEVLKQPPIQTQGLSEKEKSILDLLMVELYKKHQ